MDRVIYQSLIVIAFVVCGVYLKNKLNQQEDGDLKVVFFVAILLLGFLSTWISVDLMDQFERDLITKRVYGILKQ